MAPVAALGRQRAIELVDAGKLPVWLGSPHPNVMIVEQDGRCRIRQLVVDRAEEMVASKAALAAGRSWQPEHYHALGKPTGTIYADAASRAELVAIMRTMEWPSTW